MSGVQPVAVYALRIPPGDILIPAVPGFAAMFRVTMAAIDPSAEPDLEAVEGGQPPRATLKVVRFDDDQYEDDSDSDDYDDEDLEDSEEDSDDEENGGPSDKKSKKQKLLEALAADEKDEDEDMEDGDEDDEDEAADAAEIIKKLTQATKGKGKAKALDDEDEDDEDDLSDEGIELNEVVLCTLDPEKHYNQPLDFFVGEGEKVFFKVTGTHEVHLTGNFVIPVDDGQTSLYDEDDEEDDYDLSPDEDELDALMDEDNESDELDDIDDPRVMEVDSDDDAPALVAAIKEIAKGKGKNKRAADESDAEEDLDALVAKSIKAKEPAVNGDAKKMSKAEKKAAKKLKKNDGEAVPAATPEKKSEAGANGSEKKTVQFAKNLEQGPTPSAAPPAKKEDGKKASAAGATLGVRNVNGVTIDERKAGSGPAAKKNSKVEMRYIGKLENGKVFDSNKSGKPFAFKLGTGEVIKGWDIGLDGISAGGERRLTIPAHLAYGKKAQSGIPANSKLIFDVKCLSVK